MRTPDDLLRQARKPTAESLRLGPLYKGKIQVLPKCPVRGIEDFAIWYTPGVAAPCKLIQASPDAVYDHTNKGNSIAIVSDGTRVLGLGDIGPAAGLPVMEGKALLFKYLGGVDAIPLCIDTKSPEEIISFVQAVAPTFGGINLEDIAQPKCFRILDELRGSLDIPVWHDDQQGTATVVLAGLLNALGVVGKDIRRARIAMIGMGAANVAVYRLLKASGADIASIVVCDSRGILSRNRQDIADRSGEYVDKWRICMETNAEGRAGGIPEALRGADVCIAFARSGPGIIEPAWIKDMAADAVVFACANPVPELWPWEATAAGARVVATGRSDFPNQVNNSLVFPGIFRGVLDVRARSITDSMAMAAAHELVHCAEARGIRADAILPTMDDWTIAASIAAATGAQAQAEGLARLSATRDELYAAAIDKIQSARRATSLLMDHELIRPPPP